MAGKTELRNGVERWLDQLENGVWAERSPISRIYILFSGCNFLAGPNP